MAPSFLDAFGYRFILPFEFNGRQHPVSHVFSFRIVEHLDVVEHVLPGVSPGPIGPAPFPFAFE